MRYEEVGACWVHILSHFDARIFTEVVSVIAVTPHENIMIYIYRSDNNELP